MKLCPQCEEPNEDDARFCGHCAARFSIATQVLGEPSSQLLGSCEWPRPVESMISLLSYLEEQVISPIRKQMGEIETGFEERLHAARNGLAAAEETYSQEKAEIDGRLAAERSKITKAREKISNEIGDAEGAVRKLLESLDGIWKRTAEHGEAQQFAFSGGLVARERKFSIRDLARPISAMSLSQPQTLLARAQEGASEFYKLKKPDKLVMNWGIGCLGLIVAHFLATTAAVSLATTRAAAVQREFPLVAYVFVLLASCVGMIVLARLAAGTRMRKAFNEVLTTCEQVEAEALSCLAGTKKEAQAALKPLEDKWALADLQHMVRVTAAEERIMTPARREYATETAGAEQWKNEQIERCAARCRPIVAEGTRLQAEFVKGLHYVGADWAGAEWKDWNPVDTPTSVVRVGRFRMSDPRLTRDTQLPVDVSIPALLPLSGRPLLIESKGSGSLSPVFELVRSVMLRLLATIPPSKLQLVLVDPVGLGQNVASFMNLADSDESLVTGRVWTEPQHIEKRLADLTEHMENIIQKYLRNEYPTIADYNRSAEVPEAYRLLVVFDFPVNFNESSARRLVSVAQNGPRCGVYSVIVTNPEKPKPYGFEMSDLYGSCSHLHREGDNFEFVVATSGLYLGPITSTKGEEKANATIVRDLAATLEFEADTNPPEEIINDVVRGIGANAKTAARIEVPYAKLLEKAGLSAEQWWSASSAKILEVPLGPQGARNVQKLVLGEGTAHHGLIVGRTGSGKSNLMHIIITTLALKYSPDEVQLYLIDYKQGVEFKPYAVHQLPHARVIAIESEREFGMSVLRGLQQELLERGERFRKAGAANIAEFRSKTDTSQARVVLLVDEFQEFFSEQDSISKEAGSILDQLVRQGRSAGIHVLLGSQTLVGGNTIAPSTLGQIGIRIALQCSESDARLIMADGNGAARLLSRPGEALYNAQNGLLEGNQFFQVALFAERDRDEYLAAVDRLARQRSDRSKTIVFEGNEPAEIDHAAIRTQSSGGGRQHSSALIGLPIEIKDPTQARFRRQSGSNLLIVMRDEATAMRIVASSILSLHAQRRNAQFFFADFSMPDMDWSYVPPSLAEVSSRIIRVTRRELEKKLKELADWVLTPLDGLEIYLCFFGLHRARDLRVDADEFGISGPQQENLTEFFKSVLRDGPECGVHVVAWCDSMVNLGRYLERPSLREFALRVAGPMSSMDSNQLIGEERAAKLREVHRALLYDEERPGILETFRPYSLPSVEHIRDLLGSCAGPAHS